MRPAFVARTLAALICLSGGAMAQTTPTAEQGGYITAFSCTSLPTPLSVEVVTFDDSDPALKLQSLLVKQLQTRKIELDSDAPLRLSIDMHVAFERARQRRPDLIRLSRRARPPEDSTLHEDYETRAEVNIWSTRRDSLAGGRRPTVIGRNLEQLRLALAVHDKSTGRCLWQGEAVIDLNGRDRWAEAMRILPQLVASIGKAETRKPLIVE